MPNNSVNQPPNGADTLYLASRAREAALREILASTNQSRANEAPVFDKILGHARPLCDAPFAALVMAEPGDAHQRMVPHHGAKDSTVEIYRTGGVPMDPERSFAARAIFGRYVVHLPDMSDTDEYRNGISNVTSLVEEQGIRTNLFVPLITPGGGIGCFILFRHEVRPFDESQIELVKIFAEQAVIAIKKVRQFKALEGRTAEVEALNKDLEDRVATQVDQLERMGRLKRFLSPQVADAVISSGDTALLGSHRAKIATLFCDIRGFTAFCERAEPEETIEVLQTYHQAMGVLIAEFGAGVDHRAGDGIMVIFNDPLPCDDPTGDALRMAFAMRDRMAELSRDWRRMGHKLGFGVGISLGYATVGMVGSEGRYDYTASGTAVNLAARLCDHAADGEILLSPRAYMAVEGAVDAERVGEMEFKGIHAATEVFRAVALKTSSA